MSQHLTWSNQELDILKKMAVAGLGLEDIGRVLISRSRESIRMKAAKENISIKGELPEIDMDAFGKLMGVKSGSNRIKDS